MRIPACAGEPGNGPLPPDPLLGLSPRVRGNPVRRRRLQVRVGSIPACAGEPLPKTAGGAMYWVYPRVCGGTGLRDEDVRTFWGLSPRVRGSPHRRRRADDAARSIPACAGEPHGSTATGRPTRVYPRVCGGTVIVHCIGIPNNGLSPRVRGNRASAQGCPLLPGSIPACAGEPGSGRYHSSQCPGLSPRVRGNRYRQCAGPTAPWSIPACAGEPCETRAIPR